MIDQSISTQRLHSPRRAILLPCISRHMLDALIKRWVHVRNNGRSSNHVKRRSSPLVGIIQTSARRSCLAAPVQRLSIFVMFRRWNSDATSASSARLRTDRHPSTWRNIDYLSPTMNNRVEFAYYVRDFWRKVRSTADLRWGTNQIRCELSSDHAKPEVVSDARIRNILGGGCR